MYWLTNLVFIRSISMHIFTHIKKEITLTRLQEKYLSPGYFCWHHHIFTHSLGGESQVRNFLGFVFRGAASPYILHTSVCLSPVCPPAVQVSRIKTTFTAPLLRPYVVLFHLFTRLSSATGVNTFEVVCIVTYEINHSRMRRDEVTKIGLSFGPQWGRVECCNVTRSKSKSKLG